MLEKLTQLPEVTIAGQNFQLQPREKIQTILFFLTNGYDIINAPAVWKKQLVV